MAKYVKLGPKAESFYDPYSELSLAGKEVSILTPKMEVSSRVKAGLAGGHLSPASENDYDIFTGKTPVVEEKIESKYGTTAKELIKYYNDTYVVSDKELRAFKKKSIQGMVDELTSLEEK